MRASPRAQSAPPVKEQDHRAKEARARVQIVPSAFMSPHTKQSIHRTTQSLEPAKHASATSEP